MATPPQALSTAERSVLITGIPFKYAAPHKGMEALDCRKKNTVLIIVLN